MNIFNIFPKVSPNSMIARLMLAFLATAGLFYVNIMPAIVSGLIEALGFSNQQAGTVASANMYGAAFGALLIVFVIKRLNWQLMSLIFLLGLITLDLLSIGMTDYAALVAIRFAHGFTGGMLVGTGFSIIARTVQPDRTFGVLLFVQFGLGGVGVMLIPGLVTQYGTAVLFLSLIAFSFVTLLMLPFLPAYAVEKPVAGTASTSTENGVQRFPLTLTLLALFLFQAANMGLYAYIMELGAFYGLERDFMAMTLGIAAWLGLAGAGLVIVIGDRFGYLKSLLGGIALTTLATVAYLYSGSQLVWIVINGIIGITWAYSIAYLLGLASRFDSTGQMAALGGFASKMGLASGPALAALLLGDNNYPLVIWAAVAGLILSLLVTIVPARLQDKPAP